MNSIDKHYFFRYFWNLLNVQEVKSGSKDLAIDKFICTNFGINVRGLTRLSLEAVVVCADIYE